MDWQIANCRLKNWVREEKQAFDFLTLDFGQTND